MLDHTGYQYQKNYFQKLICCQFHCQKYTLQFSFLFCQYPQSLMDSCFIHIIVFLLPLFEWEICTFFFYAIFVVEYDQPTLWFFCMFKKKKHQICHHIRASKLLWSRLINLFTNNIRILLRAFACVVLTNLFVFPTCIFGYTIKKFGKESINQASNITL